MKLVSIVTVFVVALCAPSASQEPKNPLKNPKPAAQETSLAAERRELAQIQLLLGADRKYTEAKQRLGLLVEWLSKRTDEDSRVLLGEVEELSRSVRRSLGETVEDGRSVPADVTTRQKGDTVEEAVLAALARKDTTFLDQLGVRAGPGLVLAVRENPDELTGDHMVDVLFLLLRRDPRSADELLRELLERDGFFWKKRVVRALAYSLPWNGKVLFSTESPRRWLGPGIQATLEKYAADPDVGNDAFFHLGELVDAGADSAVFLRLLTEGLRSPDALRRDVAERVVQRQDACERMRPILERALQDGDAELRGFAAQVLAEDPGDRSLFARADDAELEVREAVLQRLEKSDLRQWQREEADALARLVLDEDDEVGERSVALLTKLPKRPVVTVLPPERVSPGNSGEFRREEYVAPHADDVYRSLSKLSGPDQRQRLVSIAEALP